MNVGSHKRVPNGRSVAPSSSSVSGHGALPEHLTRLATLISQGSVDEARRMTAASRSVGLTILESRVRDGSYAPDPLLIAHEVVTDAEIRGGLRSLAQG